VDVHAPWQLTDGDLYPPLSSDAGSGAALTGWAVHSWFDGHSPTRCEHSERAIASGCVLTRVQSASEIPPILNTRPIMLANDTHTFDLLELAPIVHGWVLLGEVGKYVRVSRDRFEDVSFSAAGITAELSGTDGESVEVAALQPTGAAQGSGGEGGDWIVQVKRVTFGKSGRASVRFAAEA
jgi:hypothetical protein